MTDMLGERLNKILPKITSEDFLRGSGLSNELPFHIFDYPAAQELRVREQIRWLLEQIPRKRPGLQVKHVNLFRFVIEYLQSRDLLERSFELQRQKGNNALMKALRGPLDAERLANHFVQVEEPGNHDLILVSGVGSAYPLVRSHRLLNTLHPKMEQTPLVLFFPGEYDGVTLRLFGMASLADNARAGGKDGQAPYYRAFRLIPEG